MSILHHTRRASKVTHHAGLWLLVPHIRFRAGFVILTLALVASSLMGTPVPRQEAKAEGGTLAATTPSGSLILTTLQPAADLQPATTVAKQAVPVPVAAVPPAAGGTGVWDAIAACESHGNWADNTGNGYYGGLQMSPSIWNNNGGQQYAARPDLATREQQIAVADTIHAKSGYGPWPACARAVGVL